MIDHLHRTIFIHIPKCAGASMEAMLMMGGNTHIYKYEGHPTMHYIRERITKEMFDDYFSFAFIRNPFDRMVSAYAYFNKRTGIKDSFSNFVCRQGLYGIEYKTNRHNSAVRHMLCLRPMTDFICDDSGSVLVDFVGRFEALYADFARVSKVIGVPPVIHRRINRSYRSRNYRCYYTSKLQHIVERRYETDLIKFNYEF